MEITKGDIYSIDNAAKKNNSDVILIGHADVKVGENIVRHNNFGMGLTYAEALSNFKKRCSHVDDQSDIVSVEITDVDINGRPFMGHGC